MKIYIIKDSNFEINENLIDQNYLAKGLADGSITEREATWEECVAEIHRLRKLEYPSVEDQVGAEWWARHGDVSIRDALDAKVAEVKAKYPKPAYFAPEPAPAPVLEKPAPEPVAEEPAPAPVVEEPAPAPVVEEPAPAPVEPEPAPIPSEPVPEQPV